MTTTDTPLYGDKTLPEWDLDWDPVPEWQNAHQDDLKYLVGLYQFLQNGRVMLIGVGTTKHGALAKRLSDYRCPSPSPSPSPRRCRSGQYVYENRTRLKIEVLVIGDVNDKQAAKHDRQLKVGMVDRHKPVPKIHSGRTFVSFKLESKSTRCPLDATSVIIDHFSLNRRPCI